MGNIILLLDGFGVELIYMGRLFSSFRSAYFAVAVRTVCLGLLCTGIIPESSMAGLFYKVQKVINLTDLNPNADGYTPICITGLNGSGRMAGYFPSSDGNKLHAFIWDADGDTFTDLNDLLGADSSMATCMNEDGFVAGVFWTADGNYTEEGFIYQSASTMVTFAAPDEGHAILSVKAINAAQSVVGMYEASGYNDHAFILQQPMDSPNFVDLGYITGYIQYIWPIAVNDSDQVIGNVYATPAPHNSSGFMWDSGTMSLIDVSGLTTGGFRPVAINNSGNIVGNYQALNNALPPLTIGRSFFWNQDDAMDLGDLGGARGASVFALTDDDYAIGTSLSGDGALHLFGRADGGVSVAGMSNLGNVSIYDGDNSFRPVSIDLFGGSNSITNFYLGPHPWSPPTFDLVGFGSDINGKKRALLWKDGAIHNVVDLMPTDLSFEAITTDWGSQIAINSAEQIACAGIDYAGNQMAVLLSVDPDEDDNGLPDSWEDSYGIHPTNTNAIAANSGLTYFQKYQLGLNPLVASTAGDTFTDGWKVAHNLNPHRKMVADSSGTVLALQVFTALR